ncbi:MAG: methionine gamma-lyase family protein [Oscillospiraceae bacterium]|jgi:cystathionine beta-lyase family protein involved in aluminum resistance|nr:methionine gamma-lyase family protein [Oscillospiraceae bacterium]
MPLFNFSAELAAAEAQAILRTADCFADIDRLTEHNQRRVLAAFIENRVETRHFAETTGYGYGDAGRETLDRLCAQIFGAQDALIRHSFACGTATISAGLFGVLRPGYTMLSVSGQPYDTLLPVLGLRRQNDNSDNAPHVDNTHKEPDTGSLRDFGVQYAQVDLLPNGGFDYPAIAAALEEYRPKMVYVQRSRGYTLRRAISTAEIGALAKFVHANSGAIVFVDNCYGEFVETEEPCSAGADLIAGSLIKNAGGGIARCGGYLAGRRDLIERCAARMNCPGLGREVGASLGNNRELFMGLFHAPHVTGEALKAAVFAAALFEELGYEVSPASKESRSDIVQCLKLGTPEKLIAFCRAIQSASPVDAHLSPEPWDMPGYDCKVIMAAGTFTGGSSIELSADAPLREPFAVWLQGGLNFHSAKAAILTAAAQLIINRQNTGG